MTLREYCVPKPPQWMFAQIYQVQPKDALAQGEQYTAAFLLTRGPYAWLGYGGVGCTSNERPRPPQWDVDYGEPISPCKETGEDTGVFVRNFAKANVQWDCKTGLGKISMK